MLVEFYFLLLLFWIDFLWSEGLKHLFKVDQKEGQVVSN